MMGSRSGTVDRYLGRDVSDGGGRQHERRCTDWEGHVVRKPVLDTETTVNGALTPFGPLFSS